MKRLIWLAAAMLCIAPAAAQEAAYPTRPITIVLAFGPGSGTDVATRSIAERLSEALGQPVIVDNRPGANGTVAAVHVANARPDGYTLFMGTNSTHGANPALQRNLPYDPVRDFAAITRVAVFTSIIVVNPEVPVRTMQELIEYGRRNEITLATGNASGVVQSETLARAVGGWRLLRVPYRSNPAAMTDVMGGRVMMMFTDIASALGQLRAGTLRPIAVTSRTRSSLMPNLPTMEEGGVPDYDLSGWIALFAPAGTPPAIVERLNREMRTILTSEPMRARFADFGAEPLPMTPQESGDWIRSEVEKWTRLVRAAGIEPE